MANKRISELLNLASANNDDLLVLYQASTGVTKHIKFEDAFPSGNDGNFEWNNLTVYALDQVVTYNGKWWQSLQASNQGNVPAENSFWSEVSKPSIIIVRPWVSGEVFTAHYALVRVATVLYGLKNTVSLPFVSNVSPVTDTTNWELVGGNMLSSNNLSDLSNVATANINLEESEAFTSVLNFTSVVKKVNHTVAGPIAYTKGVAAGQEYGRKIIHYLTADGINIPTVSADFKPVKPFESYYDNVAGAVYRLWFELQTNGKILYDIHKTPN